MHWLKTQSVREKGNEYTEMGEFLNKQAYELQEYDEHLVRLLIAKATVFDDKLTVKFKSGIEINIEM